MYGRGRRSATNSSHPPVILQAYLYIRMYYNKIRKTVNHWWDAYLLFKCSITVLPIYLILVIAGVYCIYYNVDVNVSLKSVYQAIFLPLSAAVIFIFVLLLATFNGDNRCPDEVNSNADQYEVDLDSITLPRRYSNSRSAGRHGNRGSISSSIWSAIFGNYNDEEEEEYDEDAADPGGVILTMTAEEAQEHGLIPPFGHLPPSVLLNQAQNQLVNSLEQTTAGIEFFLDQCNSFDQFINPADQSSEQRLENHNFLPPPCYYDDSSTTIEPTDVFQHGNESYQSSSILPPPRSTSTTTPFQCHLAPAIPPTYSSCTLNSIPIYQSTVVDISTECNSPARDFPPSYEEATKEA